MLRIKAENFSDGCRKHFKHSHVQSDNEENARGA